MTGVGGQVKEDCGLYLYCLVRSRNGHPLGRRGLSANPIDGTGGKVGAVSFNDLSFVVSESPKSYYDPIRSNLMAHQKIIEEVMEKGFEPLPVRFSTVACRSGVWRRRGAGGQGLAASIRGVSRAPRRHGGQGGTGAEGLLEEGAPLR